MKHRWKKVVLSCLMVLALVATLGLGCGEDEEKEKVTITIGHLTDITGPAGSALKPITNSLIDQVRDFNEQEVIPGVEIKVVVYDTKYDPSRFVPGYDWVRDRGATVISTEMGEVGEAVKAFAGRDKLPVYGYTALESIIEPPGWVFCANSVQTWQVRAILEYAGEQWDALNMGRPAKIGLVSWVSPTFYEYETGMDYCTEHPETFDYVGAYATPVGGLTWSGEVAKLKDCDYVMIAAIGGLMPATFAKEFRDKEEVHATFLGTDAVAAFKSLLIDKVGWEDMDGTITVHGWTWWTYDSPVVDYVIDILEKYRPDEVEETIASGIGGIGGGVQVYLYLEVLREAIEAVGAENFDGQAFYDAAESFSTQWEGFKEVGWSATRRYASDWVNLWEWDKDVEDLVFIKWAEVIK